MSPYLVQGARMGPEVLERLLRRIPEHRFDEALYPDRFTIREVVAHLADWEPILRARMERVLREPGCTVETFDEGQRAIDLNYSQTDVWAQLAVWRRERTATVEMLSRLTDSEMQTPLIHPEYGPIRLGDVANMFAGHDLYHIEQLTEYI